MIAAMIVNAQIGLAILTAANSGRGGFDFSVLTGGSQGGATFGVGDVTVALSRAEANESKELASIAKRPDVVKDLARYEKVVKEAKSVEQVLDDPVARKVFLKANGLGAHVDSVALAKKALASNPSDPDSLANKLSSIERGWLDVATTYNFSLFGMMTMKLSANIEEVRSNYVAEVRLDELDQRLPGLGSAILFKRVAKDMDSAIKILGSALGREVVTTALGLPKQIALQSLEAQEKALLQRLDPAKLAKPEFVDRLVTRYLIQLNGGMTGVIA